MDTITHIPSKLHRLLVSSVPILRGHTQTDAHTDGQDRK